MNIQLPNEVPYLRQGMLLWRSESSEPNKKTLREWLYSTFKKPKVIEFLFEAIMLETVDPDTQLWDWIDNQSKLKQCLVWRQVMEHLNYVHDMKRDIYESK